MVIHFRHTITAVTRWIFPPLCWHCQREGAWLCTTDHQSLDQHPLFSQPLTISGVDRVYIRGEYDFEILQNFIQRLKYHHWTGATESLDLLLRPLMEKMLSFPKGTVLIPVPLHHRRERFRGFNQSQLIAEAISHDRGWPIDPLLIRQKSTAPQAQLPATERRTNLAEAFALRPGVEKIPLSGILVDDVLTTGSTLEECAKVLRNHGMKSIAVITLAKG